MPYRSLFTFFLSLFILSAYSQERSAEAEQLFDRFKAASGFDRLYPREKVFLHFDQSAYVEGDTLWYKAYVVRTSTLRPASLSRVLYVELLNADGQLMEQQVLAIDSLGQADGCFRLGLPIRAGYYEIRAFTREMCNWGDEACFSRVMPVFGIRPERAKQVSSTSLNPDDLWLPLPPARKHVSLGTPRPYLMEANRRFRLDFYPEGGLRVGGVRQQIAFRLTDGNGSPRSDTLLVCRADSQVVCLAVPEHEGMGSFFLPPDFGKEGFVRLAGTRQSFPLPPPTGIYALSATRDSQGGMTVRIEGDASRTDAYSELLGLALFCRERATYFDTLTAYTGPAELYIPPQALHEGVNRVELFDTQGRSLCSRLVWQPPRPDSERRLKLHIRQNEVRYVPFQPIVLCLELTEANDRPVPATFSLSVSDRDGEILSDGSGGVTANLLLASELRGYIHRPDLYLTSDDATHRRMLDLLLMVQGWRANTFDVMCRADTFRLRQPIEDKLILRGTVYRDNDRFQPRPRLDLGVLMYSLDGQSFKGRTRTDSAGKFAFEANSDYYGPLIAQFTMTNDKGKRTWSRLALDRWFAPLPHPLWMPELTLHQPSPGTTEGLPDSQNAQPETFVWTDTIPRRLPTSLGEAKVEYKRKYRGFTGNRYTYNGGPQHGMARATKFYNIAQEVERYKDMGLAPGTIWDFLCVLEQDMYVDTHHDSDLDAPNANAALHGGLSPTAPPGAAEAERSNAPHNGDSFEDSGIFLSTTGAIQSKVYINNEPLQTSGLSVPPLNSYPELTESLMADEVSSVSIVSDGWADDALTGKRVNQSRARYSTYIYELPDAYRYRSQKGVERRRIAGFTRRTEFYSPDYRHFDLPSDRDVRRTLLWQPSVHTDAQGRATVILYANSRPELTLSISAQGITPQGQTIDFSR